MEIIINQWLLGFSVSIVLGGILTPLFLAELRKYRKVKKDKEVGWWSPHISGAIERGFFTVVVAVDLPGSAVAMIAWIATKMATHWNRMSKDGGDREQIDLALTALVAGLVSMLFAVVGGLICRGIEISWYAHNSHPPLPD